MACTGAVTKASVCVCRAGVGSDVTCYLVTRDVLNMDSARTAPASVHKAGTGVTALYVTMTLLWHFLVFAIFYYGNHN